MDIGSRRIMNQLTIAAALLVAASGVEGFSIPSRVSRVGNSVQPQAKLGLDAQTKRERTIVFGILDDLMEENVGDEDNGGAGDDQYLDFYHSLIFASDLKSAISNKLEECTDSGFLDYLNASIESTQDDQEKEGLKDLIDQIEIVQKETAMKAEEEQKKAAAKAQQEAETVSEAALEPEAVKPMSSADILRKANEIDAAIALSDDEKPSDFISDCREVVNLSGGFNDSGQMRVGGR